LGANVVRRILVSAAIVVLILAAVAVVGYRTLFPVLPAPVYAKDVVWEKQGWTNAQREQYYRTPQGSLIIPYSWFLALEQPGIGNRAPFSSEENLARYDLVPGPDTRLNPDHLPVGITKQTIDADHLEAMGCGPPPCRAGSSLHADWLTYSCAACHTTLINYQGKTLGIEGGRGRWNFTVFNTTMANLLLITSFSPSRFERFATKVIHIEKRTDSPEERAQIQKELREFLRSRAITGGIMAGLKNTYPTDEGYGRMDALGRGANGQFEPLDKRNVLLANAPVLIPPLWYTHDFDWVQTVAGIRQPLGRNITESWGVNSAVDLINPNPEKRFHSSIPLHHMFWMETLISVMTAPSWPEPILGKIDQDAVKLGKYLYEEKVFDGALSPAEEQWCSGAKGTQGSDGWQLCPNPNTGKKGLCARCHAPVGEVYANEFGKRYYQLPMYKLSVVGTDPADAVNFNGRQVYTGDLRAQFGGREKVGIGEALLTTTSKVLEREFEHQHIALEERPVVTGYRKNDFRAPLAYPARPLVGYWATPPYLHNGSVPNLYELLSPVNDRSATFWTGDLEYDPVKVGYRAAKFKGGFEFATRRSFIGAAGFSLRELFAGHLTFQRDIAGNSNLGHEFRDAPRGTKGVIGPYLTPKERFAIIEYMKVMGALKPLDSGDELLRRKALLKKMEPQYEGADSPDRTAATNRTP
jgi:hypothetical protein